MPLTDAEMARQLGCDPKLVARYRLRGMPMHSVRAAAAWKAANVRPRVTTGRAKKGPARSTRKAKASAPPPAAPAPLPPNPYQDARTRQAIAEANERELMVLERRGRLVDREKVRSELARRLSGLRDGLLQIPARLASVIAAETDEAKVHDLLQDELFAVLAHAVEVT